MIFFTPEIREVKTLECCFHHIDQKSHKIDFHKYQIFCELHIQFRNVNTLPDFHTQLEGSDEWSTFLSVYTTVRMLFSKFFLESYLFGGIDLSGL
jgi:hypothetical protein